MHIPLELHTADIRGIMPRSIGKPPVRRHKSTPRAILLRVFACTCIEPRRLYNSPVLTLNIVTACTCRSRVSHGAYVAHVAIHTCVYTRCITWRTLIRHARLYTAVNHPAQTSYAHRPPDNAATRLNYSLDRARSEISLEE